jgi:NADP-dependent 3-hydroxy acid dehydrogenase YdfG
LHMVPLQRGLWNDPRSLLDRVTMKAQQLAGKVAAATGASSGVGRAIARELGVNGVGVGLMARSLDGLEAAEREIRQLGGEGLVLPLDVSDADAVNAAADGIVATWNGLDIVTERNMILTVGKMRRNPCTHSARTASVARTSGVKS